MSTDIKPGQIWQWNSALPHEGDLVVTKTSVHYRYEDGSIEGEHHRDTEHFTERAHLVTDTAPLDPSKVTADDVRDETFDLGDSLSEDLLDPEEEPFGGYIDPSKVKVGDPVVVRVDDEAIGSFEVRGEVRGHLGGTWSVGPWNVASNGTWHEGVTLTDHQPAPEPEPEWKPGTVAEIEVFGDTELRAVAGGVRGDWHAEDGLTYRESDEVTDVRPLVVLDPESDTDRLSNIIRTVDGNHSLGAGALAEAILAHLGIEQ